MRFFSYCSSTIQEKKEIKMYIKREIEIEITETDEKAEIKRQTDRHRPIDIDRERKKED